MSDLRFVQIDAFAGRPLEGNPAAVMPLDAWLPDDLLQRIAAENNLSETAFLVPDASGAADRELRWFTPTHEVALCGHATLASGHLLLSDDPARAGVRFATRRAGVLEVRREDGGYALDLPATRVAPASHPALLAALGLPDGIVHLSVSGAEDTAIVEVADEDAVRACVPDMKALGAIPLMAIVTARGRTHDIVSRVFVPAWGVDEDPVTGSAHAALAPFWAARLGRDAFDAWQASKRGGRVACRVAGERVILGGACATVIEGRFFL